MRRGWLVSTDLKLLDGSFAWIRRWFGAARDGVARIPLPGRALACVAVVLLELALSRAPLHADRTLTTFDGGYFPASFGSTVTIATATAGPVSVFSGNLEVGSFPRCDRVPCRQPVLGDATYSVHGQVGLITLAIAKPEPIVPEAIPGVLLLLACVLGLLAVAARPATAHAPAHVSWRPGAIAAGVAIAAALLFPPYLHNDQLGHGLTGDWGYLGWGYVDTISSSHGLFGPNSGDVASIPSDGKSIAMPMLAGLLGGWIWPAAAGYFWSLALTALTAAGIATLGSLLWRSDSAGMAAGALFAVQPIAVGYALSFYQELGFVAFFTWGIYFALIGIWNGSRSSTVAGALFVALAVCCKSPVLAAEAAILTFFLLLGFGCTARTALLTGAQYGALALLVSVAAWPFLWVDTLQRVAYAFGARIIVDRTIHQSAPLLVRVAVATSQTLVHTGPVLLALVLASTIYLAWQRRWLLLFALLCALGAGIALVLPTALYLEHYWFYTIPAMPLLAAAVLVPIARDLSQRIKIQPRALLAGIVAIELLWALAFWPYPSAASIGCLSLQCSAARWGPSEPTYGLREAARWIREHTPPTAVIGALAAPHILQDQVGIRFVRSLWMPPAPADQQRIIAGSGVQFIVGNVWSKLANNAPATDAFVAWQGSSRDGSPTVYGVPNPGSVWLWPDAPPQQHVLDLIPLHASQVVAFPRRTSYLGHVPADRLVMPVQPQGTAPPSPTTVMQLGGGVLVTQDAAALAAQLDLPDPITTDADGSGAVALPSLAALEPLSTIRLRNVGSPYRGDHRFTAFLPASKDAYALKYLFVHVRAGTSGHGSAQLNGNVALSCAFGKVTSAYLTAIDDADSVAWLPIDAGAVGRCDPTRQRVAIAVDAYVPGAAAIEVAATPEIDRSVPAILLGDAGDAVLLSRITRLRAGAIAARDAGAPNAMIVPIAFHDYDAVASMRIAEGAHAAFLTFLREPAVRAIDPKPELYCSDSCSYDAKRNSYNVGARGRIIWAWNMDTIGQSSLVRIDLRNVHPGMGGVLAGAFVSFSNKSCYTDLRDFARNGFVYLNLRGMRAGNCSAMVHGRLGLALFPGKPISIDGVPSAYTADSSNT